MDVDLEPEPEARVIVNGEPVEGVDPLFVGSLEDARDFVLAMPIEDQAELSIFTPDRVYSAAEIRSLQIGGEDGPPRN